MIETCFDSDAGFQLLPLPEGDLAQFKRDMQEAFQRGAEGGFESVTGEILPESHIDRSLNMPGAIAYGAYEDGALVGGAVVVIDAGTGRNHLDFLYVKRGVQSRGTGQKIWNAIEGYHPDTRIWETVTPYFERRNIHFYVNRCGFHIVEFFNRMHPDPNDPEPPDEGNEAYFGEFFRFEKARR